MTVNQSKINDQKFWDKWRESGAVNLVDKEDIYDHNRLRFNPPNASGLKEELIQRVGNTHVFKVGKPENIPIGRLYERTEYSILMDNKEIGILTRVIGPDFDNTVYTGRVPGYVNEAIKIGNKSEDSSTRHLPIDQVSLQYTIEQSFMPLDTLDVPRGVFHESSAPRKDGHSLRFVA